MPPARVDRTLDLGPIASNRFLRFQAPRRRRPRTIQPRRTITSRCLARRRAAFRWEKRVADTGARKTRVKPGPSRRPRLRAARRAGRCCDAIPARPREPGTSAGDRIIAAPWLHVAVTTAAAPRRSRMTPQDHRPRGRRTYRRSARQENRRQPALDAAWPSIEPGAYDPDEHPVYGGGADAQPARRHHGTQPLPRHLRRAVRRRGGGGPAGARRGLYRRVRYRADRRPAGAERDAAAVEPVRRARDRARRRRPRRRR